MEACRLPVTSPEIPARSGPRRATPTLPRACKVQFHRRFRVSAAARSSSGGVPVEPDTQNRMFILGAGYVGRFFGRELMNSGWVVSGTCKSVEKRMELEDEGFDISLLDANDPDYVLLRSGSIVMDQLFKWADQRKGHLIEAQILGNKESMLSRMKEYSHLLVSIPPMAGIGDLMLQREHLLRNILKGGNLRWLCYLSSTSVYGDCGGELVDEDYPASPSSQVATLRLDAEKGWLDLGEYLGVSTLVFRLGGIYGPGRSAIDTLIKRKPLTESQRMRSSRQYTSRVHVEDICQALTASISGPLSSKIYNIVDDDPAPREEVFQFALGLVEKRWPGLFQDDPYPKPTGLTATGASSRGEKRVSNARMKAELGMRLLHPSYKSGLQSIVDKADL